MLPSLAGLSIHGPSSEGHFRCCGPAASVGVRRLQPPDYTAPGMVYPSAPNYDPERDNICVVCTEPLTAGGPPVEGQDRSELEKVRRCGHQFHRVCLAGWTVTQEKTTCPLCNGSIDLDEIDGMRNYLTAPREVRKPVRIRVGVIGVDVWWMQGLTRLRKLRREYQDGTLLEYMGDRPNERKWRQTSPDGSVLEYMGPQGHEREWRQTSPDGSVLEFEGPPGKEFRSRQTFPDGTVLKLDGPRGQERRLRQTRPDGTVLEYDGPPGQERKVRQTSPGGTVLRLYGQRGQERKVSRTSPDGTVVEFDGQRGQEHMVRQTSPDGTVVEFDGQRGQEHKVRQTSPDGTVREVPASERARKRQLSGGGSSSNAKR